MILSVVLKHMAKVICYNRFERSNGKKKRTNGKKSSSVSPFYCIFVQILKDAENFTAIKPCLCNTVLVSPTQLR